MGRFLVAIHAISFYVEISLAIYVICLLEGTSQLLVLALLASSTILCNFISAVRVNQTMDFYRKPCNLLYCIVLHVMHLGLLWRYIKSMVKFNRCHNKDMMSIELLHHCVVSVPVILYISRLYLEGNAVQPVFVTLIVSCFVSVVLTLSYFNDFQCKNEIDYGIWLCTLFWRAFMLFARFSAIVWVMGSPNGLWAGLMLGVHFVVLMIWYQLRDQDESDNCSGFRIWLMLLAVANTIDMTICKYKTSIQWLIGFYALMLGENIAMVGIWYSSRMDSCFTHQMLWLVAVFASFTIGLLLSLVVMTMSARDKKTILQLTLDQGCSCLQRDGDDFPFTWDTYDVQQKQKCHNNKAFVIEEKQKHVDILNNPLGVGDAVSLTTAATTGPSSPSNEIGVESPSHTDHLRRPLTSDKQVTGIDQSESNDGEKTSN